MRALLHTCCPIQRTCSCSHYVNAGPCQIPCNCSFAYSDLSIQLNVSPLLLVICPQFDARCTPHLLLNTAHIVRFAVCQLWDLSYTALLQLWDSAWNIQLNASQFLCQIPRQFNARYTPYLLPNAEHSCPFSPSQFCVLSNPAYLQFCIFMLKYSIKCISVAIGGMSAIRCALF
jgi:hypothetical protein